MDAEYAVGLLQPSRVNRGTHIPASRVHLWMYDETALPPMASSKNLSKQTAKKIEDAGH